jgi:hypothetical protein
MAAVIGIIKQAAVGACPHALWLIGKRLGKPYTDPEALLQFVGCLSARFHGCSYWLA